jgi:hypothetical protein
MWKLLIGLFIGLVIATFAPKAADVSRDFFDAGRSFVKSVVEAASD